MNYRYALMTPCWEANPDLRPTFAKLVADLSIHLGSMADYFAFDMHMGIQNPSATTSL